MKKTIGTFAVLISSLALGKDIPTIAVNGIGSISAKPDTMSIIANVETKNTNSQKAVEENNTIVKNAIELLKKDGLTD
ncbi:SIMPL domain-containing protein, partial [uncultured Cetobacterium sp.]|uniref:SIMPL domain-containing protein n=1 Tax=uncultured Cetobacterium sp. TaxID=527638 RepID=UPI002610E94B